MSRWKEYLQELLCVQYKRGEEDEGKDIQWNEEQ